MNNTLDITKLTKAQLAEMLADVLASRETEAEATPKARKNAKPKADPKLGAIRVLKPGAGRTVRLPETVDGQTAGTTWATWRDGDAKRRAWSIEGALVVDTRGLTAEQVTALAKRWNARAKVTAQGALAIARKAQA